MDIISARRASLPVVETWNRSRRCACMNHRKDIQQACRQRDRMPIGGAVPSSDWRNRPPHHCPTTYQPLGCPHSHSGSSPKQPQDRLVEEAETALWLRSSIDELPKLHAAFTTSATTRARRPAMAGITVSNREASRQTSESVSINRNAGKPNAA
jgi:hypothetical protein